MKMILSLLVFGILFSGCICPQTDTQVTGNGQAIGNGTQTTGNGNAGTGGTTGGNTNQDLTGKTYAQLAALGLPMECDITTINNGQSTSIKMYMNGDNSRMETTSSSGDACPKYIFISDKTNMYMGCEGGNPYGSFFGSDVQCDWIQLNINSGNVSGTGSVTNSPDIDNLPPTSFNCKLWILDQSKFATPGKICDMQDMFGGAYPTN